MVYGPERLPPARALRYAAMLRERGCDITLRDERGRTAAEVRGAPAPPRFATKSKAPPPEDSGGVRRRA